MRVKEKGLKDLKRRSKMIRQSRGSPCLQFWIFHASPKTSAGNEWVTRYSRYICFLKIQVASLNPG